MIRRITLALVAVLVFSAIVLAAHTYHWAQQTSFPMDHPLSGLQSFANHVWFGEASNSAPLSKMPRTSLLDGPDGMGAVSTPLVTRGRLLPLLAQERQTLRHSPWL